MASLTAVRILCSIAVTNNLPLMHSDIPQAFIQSMLDSDSSWMTLPKGVSLLDTEGNSVSERQSQEDADGVSNDTVDN